LDNAELAYLLGMITGKGTIVRDKDYTSIYMEIPHKNLFIEGMDVQLSVKASLEDIRNILEPLIGVRITSTPMISKTILRFVKSNDDFLIREINQHFNRLSTCKDFRIPQGIIGSPLDIKREFMIGLADVTAHIRRSNAAFGLGYGHRVYIEIPANWLLVVDIANLLLDLDIPIHTIDWGHPNMRDPNLEDYKKGKHNVWFREHQVKIFADEFEGVGFRMAHKSNTLREFADFNRDSWDQDRQNKLRIAKSETQKRKFEKQIGHLEIVHHKFYWETREPNRPKPHHPMEGSEKIPSEIRGRHFDSWKEICNALGYPRG
jgi:hypothetical protein